MKLVIIAVIGATLLMAAPAQAAPYLSKGQARYEANRALERLAWSADAVDYWVEDAGRCARRSRSVVLCEGWIDYESPSPSYGKVYSSQCHELIRVKKLPSGFPWASFPYEPDCG
jgi:hypothetical protein